LRTVSFGFRKVYVLQLLNILSLGQFKTEICAVKEITDGFSTIFANRDCYISDYDSESGFVSIKSIDEFIDTTIASITISESDLIEFLQGMVREAIAEGEYDARARTVAKHMFFILHAPNRFLQAIENRENSNQNYHGASDKSFLDTCRGENVTFPALSLSRIFQIGAAAAVGGALMCIASSANGINKTIIP
jgi:hypothetical protein